ncbi:MAG: translin family protein [Promethearchaeota archaeon]|nr:MAG: translin family protein [Candidatus Lokiarchaeota archaeon]
MSLNKIFTQLTDELDKLDYTREEILKNSRKIIRDCSVAIKAIHRREMDQYIEKINSVKTNHENLLALVNKDLGVFFKYLKTPEQEYAEAISFYSIIKKKELPTPLELNINPLNYALGLADVIGELRRYILDNIRNSQIQDINEFLDIMDEIYTQLFSLDYPSGITHDLRHKTDVARTIIERTRGDISISVQMSELKSCLEQSDMKFRK